MEHVPFELLRSQYLRYSADTRPNLLPLHAWIITYLESDISESLYDIGSALFASIAAEAEGDGGPKRAQMLESFDCARSWI